ncbi:MAG TPA: histidinol-phosphate transaminase [Candidatus Sulfotelmatobacter sp.]|nr:histidinol-phosphate transaminase [Candidatus Sulfotelmatobacter sp.]
MKAECKRWLDEKIARIQGQKSYSAESTNESIAKKYGLKPESIMKLNYNENLFLPKERIVSLLKAVAEECDLRIYPQDEEVELKEKIGEYLQVPVECIAVGNSSDEVMERTIRIFLEKGNKAVTFIPTFSVFKCCVDFSDAQFIGVSLRDDFTVDIEGMEATFTPETKLLYLCSPNNPTANQLKQREVEALIEDFPGIVLVDEAYAEYADYSVVPLINKYRNLIVLRTFSKAFGLAGIRLGYAVANPTLALTINKLPAPYAISVISLSMGRKMLENVALIRESAEALKMERRRLIDELNEIKGTEAFESKTNFVLFNTDKSYEEIYEDMLKQGLIIKKLGRLLKYPNCLRTTVGLPEMNRKLLKALRQKLED